AVTRPFTFLRGAAKGLGRTLPHRGIVQKLLEFGLGLTLEIIPVQVVFADVFLAEPVVIIKCTRRFGCTILARLGAAGLVAPPGRGLERTRHATPALCPALFVRSCGNIESERVAVAHLRALS